MSQLFRSSRLRSATALLIGVFCVAMVGCGNGGSVQAAEPDPETLIQAMLQTQQDSWNKNDASAYAAVFSEDVDFINIRGQIFSGKTAVAQLHAKIFAGPFKGSTISVALRSLKMLSPGVAVVDTDQTVTSFAGLPPGIVATAPGVLFTHFKYIAVKQDDGSWVFTAGQNTSALPN